MISACALIEDNTFHLIQMITKKNVEVIPHISLEFFSKIVIDNKYYDTTCFIGNK
jgi:hypothetical protein